MAKGQFLTESEAGETSADTGYQALEDSAERQNQLAELPRQTVQVGLLHLYFQVSPSITHTTKHSCSSLDSVMSLAKPKNSTTEDD